MDGEWKMACRVKEGHTGVDTAQGAPETVEAFLTGLLT